jgi:hypothetical protein
MKIRQVAPLACLALLVITPAACTMPDQTGPGVRNSYPPIVQTETGGTPMLQDNSTGLENATRGVKTKN